MSKKKSSIWGDLGFLLVIGLLFLVIASILQLLGVIPKVERTDAVILVGAFLSLGLSAVFNIYSSEGHAYHRLGFELCGLTLGICLSLLVAQFLSSEAALPRLGHAALRMSLDHSDQMALVSLFGLGSVFCMGVTALIVRSIDADKPPSYPQALSFLSFLIGLLMMFGYVTLLLGASQ